MIVDRINQLNSLLSVIWQGAFNKSNGPGEGKQVTLDELFYVDGVGQYGSKKTNVGIRNMPNVNLAKLVVEAHKLWSTITTHNLTHIDFVFQSDF